MKSLGQKGEIKGSSGSCGVGRVRTLRRGPRFILAMVQHSPFRNPISLSTGLHIIRQIDYRAAFTSSGFLHAHSGEHFEII